MLAWDVTGGALSPRHGLAVYYQLAALRGKRQADLMPLLPFQPGVRHFNPRQRTIFEVVTIENNDLGVAHAQGDRELVLNLKQSDGSVVLVHSYFEEEREASWKAWAALTSIHQEVGVRSSLDSKE